MIVCLIGRNAWRQTSYMGMIFLFGTQAGHTVQECGNPVPCALAHPARLCAGIGQETERLQAHAGCPQGRDERAAVLFAGCAAVCSGRPTAICCVCKHHLLTCYLHSKFCCKHRSDFGYAHIFYFGTQQIFNYLEPSSAICHRGALLKLVKAQSATKLLLSRNVNGSCSVAHT